MMTHPLPIASKLLLVAGQLPTNAYTHICTHPHTYICAHTHAHTLTYTHIHTQVCWHSKTNRIVGLAMTQDHLATLSDVYEQLKEDKAKKTTYILQFMWRDLSSKFDLIGPYYTSECGLDSRFTTACLFEVMQAMESTGFQIHALICDGASWNLTMLKHLCGAGGKFGSGEMTDPERYDVPCSFKNPFSDNNVWIIICPSHQVKNHLGIP